MNNSNVTILKLINRLVPRSLTGRLFIGVGTWAVVALLVGWFVLSAAFSRFAYSNIDQRMAQTLDALIGITEISEENTIYFTRPLADQRFEVPYSGWYWQIHYLDNETVRSRSLWDWELFTNFNHNDYSEDYFEGVGPEDQVLRIVERDIFLNDGSVKIRYFVAVDKSEIEKQIDEFNNLLIITIGGLGLGFIATIILQVSFGLYPLKRIRSVLSDVRTGRARRLKSDFPREILPLVDEVNAVLDHNDTLVARARTHVGNLAHALKTPISVLKNEAMNEKETKFGALVSRQVGRMEKRVEHELVRARVAGRSRVVGAKTDVAECVSGLMRSLKRIYPDKEIDASIDIDSNIKFWGEREDLDEILGNLLENAYKWSNSKISINTEKSEIVDGGEAKNCMTIIIEDDGPGVSKEMREQMFERGRRLDESVPGTGLGMAIVLDIVKICEGELSLSTSKLGGLKVMVRLPATNI